MSAKVQSPAEPNPEVGNLTGWRSWGFWFLPLAATLLVYIPALQAGFIWNDADYVTKPALQSWDGLRKIWFQVGATEQYYPLLHSFFWIQHVLFGDVATGSATAYHAVNILLHGLCAVMLGRVTARLFTGRRGNQIGLAAGLLFAVHPVYVESVAWISEQKNTFSLLLYLLAALAYLSFEDSRSQGGESPDAGLTKRYWIATALFALALLAKSVTASLPAALLVVAWWRRGRLDWKLDLVPLLPWFALGAAMGLLSGYVERTFVGAQGEDFDLGVLGRGLLAGRVLWFYLGKYVWPAELIFIYPRWVVDASQGWQWIFPLGAVALLVVLWWNRSRARGPLAALLYFAGSMVPTIGFFNVYAFKFSYVADHWNYLPSVGLAVTIAYTAVALLDRLGSQWRAWSAGAAALVLVLLGVLSWKQCAGYRDLETFYNTILTANPNCWLAHNNLGKLELERGRLPAAERYFEQTIRLRPKDPEPQNNLGVVLVGMGRTDEAMEHYQTALRLYPEYANAYLNLGNLNYNLGRISEAADKYASAVKYMPSLAAARNNLGLCLSQLGNPQDAIPHFEAAVAVRKEYPEAQHNWGFALLSLAKFAEAIPHFQEAVRLRPQIPDWQVNLGVAFSNAGKPAEAIVAFERALALRPDSSDTHFKIAVVLFQAGKDADATAHNREGQRLRALGR